MTVHLSQPSLRQAVALVIEIAQQLDADSIPAEDRANAAVSYVIERQSFPWPLSLQRQIMHEATAALALEALEMTGDPVQEQEQQQEVSPSSGSADASAMAQPVEVPQTAVDPERNAASSAVSTPDEPKPKATLPTIKSPVLAKNVEHPPLEALDFSEPEANPQGEQEFLVRSIIETVASDRRLHLQVDDVPGPVVEVTADTLELGPLETLLADDSVTYIMVNSADQVFVERNGELERTQGRFRDDAHVFTVASRLVAAGGRHLNQSEAMVDLRLADGSHVNIAVPPLALNGPTITIRKFPNDQLSLEALVKNGSLSTEMSRFLALATCLRLNILVSGGVGSGKTVLLNALSGSIPDRERIVTIEDVAELGFQPEHVVRFETRAPSLDGTGEVTAHTLLRNALRMRPDRIIIGEIRGQEALGLLQAMNTGHDGSMSTLYANSPTDALTRIENMAALARFTPPADVVRRQIADAVQLIVQVAQMHDGQRRVISISEPTGLSGDVIALQDLFSFQIDPESSHTKVIGKHVYSGHRPGFADRAADFGMADALNSILGTK